MKTTKKQLERLFESASENFNTKNPQHEAQFDDQADEDEYCKVWDKDFRDYIIDVILLKTKA